MTISEISKQPGFEAAASSSGGAATFAFIGTFGYMALFSGTRPGLFAGLAFFVLGMFAAPLLIAAPLFALTSKLPRVGALLLFASPVGTFFATRAVYLWMFAATPVVSEPFAVSCREPIPEFTLGAMSNPSEAQVSTLCTCVSGKLGTWERETAQAIREGREAQVAALNLRAFPSRFGSAVQDCGGYGL